MMTREQLERAAGDMGFSADSLEKVWMLVRLLNLMYSHPFLGPRIALKGGTALNLFVFDLPRLSVDIDVNYIGAADRGKLAALFARGASRDLFDARGLLLRSSLDTEKLRLGFVVYGGANRLDWRTVSVEAVATTVDDVKRLLLPMLRHEIKPATEDVEEWTAALVRDTRAQLGKLLPLRVEEVGFLDRLNDAGEIRPELLTEDDVLQERIRVNPGLQWKALNVRKHKGRS